MGDFTRTVFERTIHGDTLAGEFREGEAVGGFRLTRAATAPVRLEQEEVSFANGDVTLRGTVIYPPRVRRGEPLGLALPVTGRPVCA